MKKWPSSNAFGSATLPLGPSRAGAAVADPQSDVEETLREIVRKNSRVRLASIDREHTLARDLGFDSFALLMALTDLESKLGLNLPLERIEALRDLSFGGLVAFVLDETRKAGRAHATLETDPSRSTA